MSDNFSFEDLTADEIVELLADEGSNVAEEQLAALKSFIQQAGGIDDASLAIEMLDGQNKAA